MTKIFSTFVIAASIFVGLGSQAEAQFLGSADTFAVLSGTSISNAGPTAISGDVGVSPGNSATGFTTVTVTNGTVHLADTFAANAQADALTAFNPLSTETANSNLTGQDLGGKTLFAGVYHFDTSAFLTGILTLDTQGDPNARFDFQIGTTLITAANSSVVVLNSPADPNIFFQVGTSAMLGTNTAFAGHILAATSITVGTGASIRNGGALARNGAVTLASNSISASRAAVVPEPSSFVLMCAIGSVVLAAPRRRK